ncbi:MAG: PilW family protein [Trueperaceae bacterium]
MTSSSNLQKRTLGISLIELLISMGILGILLATLTAFLVSNQQVTTSQVTSATLSNDVRLAHLRLGEIVSQAHYIYPSGQTINIDGTPYVTGALALAVLVPRGTTYCKREPEETDTRQDYCGFAYVVTERTPYVDLLGESDGTTGQVLIEFKSEGLEWVQADSTAGDTNPALTLLNWNNLSSTNPVADSVDEELTNVGAELTFSSIVATFDKETNFQLTGSSDTVRALIGGVTSTIALERTVRGKEVTASRENYVFSKAIPRTGLPNQPR